MLRTYSGTLPDAPFPVRQGDGFLVIGNVYQYGASRGPNVTGSCMAAELGVTAALYQDAVMFVGDTDRGLTVEAEMRIRLMWLNVRAAIEGRVSELGEAWDARVCRDAILYSQGSVPSKKTDPFGDKRVWSRCPTELCVHPLGMHDQHMRCKIPGCECHRLKGEYVRVY